jgi:branched-chain amino acid transport system permease protein
MLVFGLVMMVMMVVRREGLLPIRSVRFRESDVRRATPPAAPRAEAAP